jgi:hypothetical protein
MFSLRDHPIPQIVEDVHDIEFFAYEKRQRYIVKRIDRKRKITLYSGALSMEK